MITGPLRSGTGIVKNPAMVEELAEFFKALGDPVRLNLLLRLKDHLLTVSELASSTGTSVANVSKHLAFMRRTGLLERRKQGNQVYYTISNRNVLDMCDVLCGSICERLAARSGAFSEAQADRSSRSEGGRRTK
jgi:ArsR family transcriptional regulator